MTSDLIDITPRTSAKETFVAVTSTLLHPAPDVTALPTLLCSVRTQHSLVHLSEEGAVQVSKGLDVPLYEGGSVGKVGWEHFQQQGGHRIQEAAVTLKATSHRLEGKEPKGEHQQELGCHCLFPYTAVGENTSVKSGTTGKATTSMTHGNVAKERESK